MEISRKHRKYGVKLTCLRCGLEKHYYTNFNKLEEAQLENEQEHIENNMRKQEETLENGKIHRERT